MKEKFKCVTNNPLLLEKGYANVEYHETDVLSLFRILYEEIVSGSRLLSHPLSGSIRPDMTPYKSVLLAPAEGTVDELSVSLIRKAIRYAEDLYKLRETPLYRLCSEEERADFAYVDCNIIERAMGTLE